MNEIRIVSFLPAATEMACALGLVDQLVGITHECDHPPAVQGKPVVVRTVLPVEKMSPREIDTAVSELLRSGRSLYEVDVSLLRELAPTHILTQALCSVCAPAGAEVGAALNALSSKPRILSFTPKSLEDIQNNLRELGRATGCEASAESLILSYHARLQKLIDQSSRASSRPRVFC